MSRLSRLHRILVARPRLWLSIAVGVAVFVLLPRGVATQAESRVLLAWNVGALLYLALALHMMRASDVATMRRRARQLHEGRALVLAMTVFAAVAVLLAVFSQLVAVKDLRGAAKAPHAALASITVITSWLFTQTLFALNYAHDFYVARIEGRGDLLTFPGTDEPGYADFWYFACVIGTSGQTADVSFNGAALRPVGALHCVLAFFFNTTVLALAINIAAGMF